MDTEYKMLSAAPFVFKMLSWTTVVFGAIGSVIILAGGSCRRSRNGWAW